MWKWLKIIFERVPNPQKDIDARIKKALDEFVPKYCYECFHIVKPVGVPYWPHPEAECSILGQMNYVTGKKDIALCKDYNKYGGCKFWSVDEGEK